MLVGAERSIRFVIMGSNDRCVHQCAYVDSGGTALYSRRKTYLLCSWTRVTPFLAGRNQIRCCCAHTSMRRQRNVDRGATLGQLAVWRIQQRLALGSV